MKDADDDDEILYDLMRGNKSEFHCISVAFSIPKYTISITLCIVLFLPVCVCACLCARARVCVCVCVRARACARACVHARRGEILD